MLQDCDVRAFPKKHWAYPLIALLASLVMVVRVVLVTNVYNNTIDEPYHIGSAMVLWESKQLVVGAQHPPLARWVIGLPLVLQGVRYPEARDEYVVVEYAGFDIGRQLLVSGQVPYWRMLTAARHSLLIFSLLALFYIYRLGRYFGDSLIAMLATVFFSFDPTFLAHSALVGTDTAGCAGFVGGLYYGLRFCDKPRVDRALVCGLSLGLACSCKLSCVLLIPILILIAVLRRIRWRRRLPSIGLLAFIVVIAFVVLWATYGLCDQSDAAAGNFFGSTRSGRSCPKYSKNNPSPCRVFFSASFF